MIYPPYGNSECSTRLSVSKVRRFAEDLLSRVRQSQHAPFATIVCLESCMRHLAARYKLIDVALFLESLEPLEIENRDAAIADAHEAGRCQPPQRLVHALAWKADEIGEFFLRDRQRFVAGGIQHRIEQRRQLSRQSGVRAQHAIVLDHRDELPQTLVELYQKEAVERDAGVEQQHERIAR